MGAMEEEEANQAETQGEGASGENKETNDIGNVNEAIELCAYEEEDNCDTLSAPEVGFIEWETEMEDALRDSPVMKVYTKGPTTIGELESMGRLIRK